MFQKFRSLLVVSLVFIAKSASAADPCAVDPQDPLTPYLRYLQRPDENADPQVRDAAEKLVRSYAPRIWWHPKERIGAIDPLEFIQNSSLWSFSGRSRYQIAAKGETHSLRMVQYPMRTYLKFEGRKFTTAQKTPPPMLWKVGEGAAAARLCRGPLASRRVLIEYWYHSPYNHATSVGIGNHEGDWEGLAMLVEIGFDGRELSHRLDAAYLAAHETGRWHCSQDLGWTDAPPSVHRLVSNSPAVAGHPEAFSALGTHATYSTSGKHSLNSFFTDVTGRGKAWDTWENLRPLVHEPYYGFAGQWGNRAAFSFMSGPQAPGPGFKPQPRDHIPIAGVESCGSTLVKNDIPEGTSDRSPASIPEAAPATEESESGIQPVHYRPAG